MQTLCHSLPVASSRTAQPPRSANFRSSRLRLPRSPKPLGHAVQRLSSNVVWSSAATEAEPATPLVSHNAAEEVPHAEVASEADLAAAANKTQSGPNTDPNEQQQQKSAPARTNGAGRSGGRSRRPRTVQPEQLVPGAQFEGNVVSVMAYGAFVDIGAVTDGLVHISQLADEYIPDPNQVVHNGQEVTVKVSSWDPSKQRLSLSMKLNDSAAEGAAAPAGGGYLDRSADRQPRQGKVARAGGGDAGRNKEKQLSVKMGDKLTVKVGSMTGYGAFCDIEEGVRGLLHVDQMNWPEGAIQPSAYDCMKEGDELEVYVLKIAKGAKVALTQKTEEERQAEATMAQSGMGAGPKRGTKTMSAALSSLGFKATPKPKKKKEGATEAAPAASVLDTPTSSTETPPSPPELPVPAAKTSTPASDIPAPTAEAPADAPAATDNQATVELGKDEQSDALDRQINPKGDPTPMELPPEAQKAADDAPASDAPAPAAPDAGTSAGTGNQASAELGKNEQDEALRRQLNPRGGPTPMDLPPEARKAAEDAKQNALEGEESGEAGQGEPGTADTSNSVEVTAPKDEPSAAPSEVAEGVDPPAVSAQLDATPQKESNLPQDAPKEVGEGVNPEQAGGEEKKPATGDDSATVEVTAPSEPDTAAPADIAEGEESPLESATNASLSDGAQAQQKDKPSSAAALAGAESADALPGSHAQPAQAGLAGADGAERTAPPSAASNTTADSASTAAAGTSTSSPGGSSGHVSAVSVSEPKQEAATASGAVSAADVKQLRQETGAGMMDCKRALTAANGDIAKATEALRKKGLAAADKKAGRIAAEGLLTQYIHAGSRLGVIVEVNCETDFVARGDVFKQLANDMAMQVAACPQVTVVDTAEVPADVVEKERNVQLGKEDIIKKPENIRGKIVDGRIQKFLAEQALLEQAFIKDTTKTVATLIKEATATVGEKISIRRFERYQLGEGLVKKESDLAADVEEQQAALQAKAAEKKTQEPAAAVEQIPDQPSVKVDAKLVKQLRDSSGAGMMDCKKALANNDNNLEKATEFLRKKGLASADKKAGRMASEGAIASYVHAGSKLGVLIEVNCETDFVARGAKFKELVQDLAMQAAASPSAIVVALQDVPEAEIEKERAIEMGKEDIQSKPEAIRPKIVEGRLNKIRSQKALLEQPFIKDTGSTVAEQIKSAVASLGENIQIRRFTRYNLGEGIQKKQEDFAAEVAAQTGQ